MKLIVGLGNPGEKYQNNRHNVGFMFVDYLLATCNSQHKTSNQFMYDKYLLSEVCKLQALRFGGQATSYKLQNDIVLLKPQTFMNKSGVAIKSCVTRYTLNVTRDLIVVHDDLDIPLGKFKIQKGSGPKLHNGLESIENKLMNKDFLRIRIGVDNRDPNNRIDGETYVLQDFREEEKKIIRNTFLKILAFLMNL